MSALRVGECADDRFAAVWGLVYRFAALRCVADALAERGRLSGDEVGALIGAS